MVIRDVMHGMSQDRDCNVNWLLKGCPRISENVPGCHGMSQDRDQGDILGYMRMGCLIEYGDVPGCHWMSWDREIKIIISRVSEDVPGCHAWDVTGQRDQGTGYGPDGMS